MKNKWEVREIPKDAKVARVFSPSNIALAKYWGKRDTELNLPTNGSLSATLQDYGSFTTAAFSETYTKDTLVLNGEEQSGGKLEKVLVVLDEIRKLAKTNLKCLIQSENNFPTGAGLASSASGLSAVTFAAANALGVASDIKKLSEIARKGSGSACRSLFGGYAEWSKGTKTDGTDSIAHQVFPETHWPLDVLLVLVNQNEKHQASTGGMEITRKTSPYFPAWIEAAEKSLNPIRDAISKKDFHKLAEEAEVNCIRFHTSAMAANPPIIYWQGRTLDLVHEVKALRASGLKCFFTIDAGPNVCVFCDPKDTAEVEAEISKMSGVKILRTKVGAGARLL